MPEPIPTIKTATEIVKPDSASEILALQSSSDTRLQNAGNYEADTKQKIAETKNFLATIAHGGLVVPLKKVGGAVIKIAESFSLHSESTKNAINNKVEHLKSQGILSGEISSIPAFADMAERLVYLDEEPDLKQMFEDLLVSTVDSTKININHPAYVEILKQISNLEALNLKKIFAYSNGKQIPICNIRIVNEDDKWHYYKEYLLPDYINDISKRELENWERLKLIYIGTDKTLAAEDIYNYAEEFIKVNKNKISEPEKLELEQGYLIFTEFGKNFANAVGITTMK